MMARSQAQAHRPLRAFLTLRTLAATAGASLAFSVPSAGMAQSPMAVDDAVSADAVLMQPQVTLKAARRVVAAALAEAQRHDWRIGVAVVDAGGELVAFERSDGALAITPAVAQGKARTAALLKAPSKEFEDFINSGRPSFLSTPGVTALEGGIPLRWQGQVIGAVGVSGAHGAQDTQVAEHAAAALLVQP